MIEHSAFLTPCLYPNYTIREIETPIDMILHSFTPCGKFLICFTVNGVAIYQFNNQAGIVLDQHCFEKYFELKTHALLLLPSIEELSNGFCVATLDHNYIIVVSSSEYSPLQPRQSRSISVQADYHFYTICLMTGKIVDKYTFKNDYIEIEKHRGVGLVQNIFAVLSLLHQTIYIIQINKRGEFHLLQSIGSSLHSDDALLQDLYPCMQSPLYNSLGALHQAIVVFRYKDKNISKRLFYQEFELAANLKIVRIQLMESVKLFLRMVPEENVCNPMASSYVLFVIVDIPSSKVIDVFDNKNSHMYCPYLYKDKSILLTLIIHYFDTTVSQCSTDQPGHVQRESTLLKEEIKWINSSLRSIQMAIKDNTPRILYIASQPSLHIQHYLLSSPQKTQEMVPLLTFIFVVFRRPSDE